LYIDEKITEESGIGSFYFTYDSRIIISKSKRSLLRIFGEDASYKKMKREGKAWEDYAFEKLINRKIENIMNEEGLIRVLKHEVGHSLQYKFGFYRAWEHIARYVERRPHIVLKNEEWM